MHDGLEHRVSRSHECFNVALRPEIILIVEQNRRDIPFIKKAESDEAGFAAEPSHYFNLKRDWTVVEHNLDDGGDVEQVAGPFATRMEADHRSRATSTLTHFRRTIVGEKSPFPS